MRVFALVILFLTVSVKPALSFVGTFYSPEKVPETITNVKFDAYNYTVEREPGEPLCLDRNGNEDSECYRIDVYLNDIHVATFPTSPGKPHYGTDHVGGYTPIYNGVPVHTTTYRDYVSATRKYYMPYAMFFESLSKPRQISDVAIHSGHRVNGRRLSRGCLRTLMSDVELMFSWTVEARKNGGNGYLWTRHMKDQY